jgi:hypothetical protein
MIMALRANGFMGAAFVSDRVIICQSCAGNGCQVCGGRGVIVQPWRPLSTARAAALSLSRGIGCLLIVVLILIVCAGVVTFFVPAMFPAKP